MSNHLAVWKSLQGEVSLQRTFVADVESFAERLSAHVAPCLFLFYVSFIHSLHPYNQI